MIALGPLVLVLVIWLVVRAVQAAGGRPPRTPLSSPPGVAAATPASLAASLERWVDAGLVSHEQASAIEAFELAPVVPSATSSRPGRLPAVAEALGYLGGVLATIGLVLLVARYWPDMATAGRLALSGGGAAALVAGGALVHTEGDDALTRLRGFLWLASTAAAGLFGGVLANGGFGADSGKVITLAVAATVVAESAGLWWRRTLPLQHLTLFVGLVVTVGAAVAQVAGTGPVGAAVWASGVALVALGVLRRTPLGELTELIGAVAAMVGATMTISDWQGAGFVFAVVTAVAILTLVSIPGLPLTEVDQRLLGVTGAIGLLEAGPAALTYFARDAGLATGLVLWVAGAVLLVVGMRALVRLPLMTEVVGAAAVIGGAALTGAQAEGFAPVFGLVTAVGLIVLGMLPGRVLLSVFGSLGVLINVLWGIGHFFPGEGRAPLLVMVAGVLTITIAVLLTRSGRLGRELRPPRGPVASAR